MSVVAAIGGLHFGVKIGKENARVAEQQRRYAINALKRAEQRNEEMQSAIMAKYDDDGSEGLDRQQLKRMLTDCSLESIGKDVKVTDDDVDFIMCLVEKAEGDTGGQIKCQQVRAVVEAWKAFLERSEQIAELLQKFDVNKNGHLERFELQPLLVQLSGGREVPTEVVEWILDQADLTKTNSLNRVEVSRAIALCYLWLGDGQIPFSADYVFVTPNLYLNIIELFL